MLDFVRGFGLVLFVYALGLQIGPGFFSSLRARGLLLNALATAVVVLGVGITALLIAFGWVPLPTCSGLLSGATTNTPSLASGHEALRAIGATEAFAVQGVGYAVAYPFGIIGIILTMLAVRAAFRIDVRAEVAEAEMRREQSVPKLATRSFEVRNPNLAGLPLGRLPGLEQMDVVISRVSRDRQVEVARPDLELRVGDVLHAVGSEQALDDLR